MNDKKNDLLETYYKIKLESAKANKEETGNDLLEYYYKLKLESAKADE